MKKIYILSVVALSIIISGIFAVNTVGAQYYNYGNCTYHAYKLCVGNSMYWYSGCDQQQDLYYTCSAGQTCNNPGQYGQCATPYIQPVPNPNPYPPYVVNYRTACYGSSLYWYDSLGVSTGLYKNCVDNNSCTIDSCSAGECLNTLDISCQPIPTPTPTPTPVPVPATDNLSISFFAKQDLSSGQWQKTVQVGPEGTVYFLIPVVNSSANQIDNINVSVNIPSEIASLGNLQINNVPISGDIVSGINIGSLSATSTKSITFEGKAQTILMASTKQAVAKSNVLGSEKTDSISISFVTEKATASVSSSGLNFSEFLRRWYMWLLAGLVLLIVVIVVFRRFSSPS